MQFKVIGKMKKKAQPRGCAIVLREVVSGEEHSIRTLHGDPSDPAFRHECRIFMCGICDGIKTATATVPNVHNNYDFEEEEEEIETTHPTGVLTDDFFDVPKGTKVKIIRLIKNLGRDDCYDVRRLSGGDFPTPSGGRSKVGRIAVELVERD